MEKKRIRVAEILNRMDSGGIEAVVLNYFRHMDRDAIQMDFFCDESSMLPYRSEMEEKSAGICLLPPYTHPVKYVKALEERLKNGRYDIAHVHMNAMSVFALYAAKRAGIPVRICQNHSTASWQEGTRTLIKVLLRPWCRVFATAYFACGQQAAQWMYGRRLVESNAVLILPNAIETEAYAYSPISRKAVREELGIREDAFVVGHVGRFMKQKNHRFLLELFRGFAEKRTDAVLLLIGEGKLEDEVRDYVQTHELMDRVFFAGVRGDVNRLYSAMDVFCLPSLYEGFPVVLVETQANGLPAICSDRVSPEICITELVTRLPLENKGEWLKALVSAKRKRVLLPGEYEITAAVNVLEKKYRELTAG